MMAYILNTDRPEPDKGLLRQVRELLFAEPANDRGQDGPFDREEIETHSEMVERVVDDPCREDD